MIIIHAAQGHSAVQFFCQVLVPVVAGENIAVIQGGNLVGRIVIVPIGQAHRLILGGRAGIAGLVNFLQEGQRCIALVRIGAEDGNICLGPGIGVAHMGGIAPQGQDARLIFRICCQGHTVHTGNVVGIRAADVETLQVYIIRQGNLQSAIAGFFAAGSGGLDVSVPGDLQGVAVVQFHCRTHIPVHVDGLVPVGEDVVQLFARHRIFGGRTDVPLCQVGQPGPLGSLQGNGTLVRPIVDHCVGTTHISSLEVGVHGVDLVPIRCRCRRANGHVAAAHQFRGRCRLGIGQLLLIDRIRILRTGLYVGDFQAAGIDPLLANADSGTGKADVFQARQGILQLHIQGSIPFRMNPDIPAGIVRLCRTIALQCQFLIQEQITVRTAVTGHMEPVFHGRQSVRFIALIRIIDPGNGQLRMFQVPFVPFGSIFYIQIDGGMGNRRISFSFGPFFPGQEQMAHHGRIVRCLGLVQGGRPVAVGHVPVRTDGPQSQRTAHQVLLQVHSGSRIAVTAADLGGHVGRRIIAGQFIFQVLCGRESHIGPFDRNGAAQGQFGPGAVVARYLGTDVRLFLDQFLHVPDAGRIVVVRLAGNCSVIGGNFPIRTGDTAAQIFDLLGTGTDAAAGEPGCGGIRIRPQNQSIGIQDAGLGHIPIGICLFEGGAGHMGQVVVHVDRIGGYLLLCLRRHMGVGSIGHSRGPAGHGPLTDLIHQTLQLAFRSRPVGLEIVLVKGGIVQAGNGVALGIQENILDVDPSIGRNPTAGKQRSGGNGPSTGIQNNFPKRGSPRIAVQDHPVIPVPQGDRIVQFQGIVGPFGIAFGRSRQHQVVVSHTDGGMFPGFRLGLAGRLLDRIELAAVYGFRGIGRKTARSQTGNLSVSQIDTLGGTDLERVLSSAPLVRRNDQSVSCHRRGEITADHIHAGEARQIFGKAQGQPTGIPCNGQVAVLPFDLEGSIQGHRGAAAVPGKGHAGAIKLSSQISDMGRIGSDILVGGKKLAAVHPVGAAFGEVCSQYIRYFLAVGIEAASVDIGICTHFVRRGCHPASTDGGSGVATAEGGTGQVRQLFGQFHFQAAVAAGNHTHVIRGQFFRIFDSPRNAQGIVQGQGVGRACIAGEGVTVAGQGHQMGAAVAVFQAPVIDPERTA